MKLKRLLIVVLIAAMILSGCSGGAENSPAKQQNADDQVSQQSSGGEESKTSQDQSSAQKRVLTVGMTGDLRTFDTQNHNEATSDNILTNMTSKLFRRDQEENLYPELVTEYEVVDDLTWRFKIRDDVKFHNGDMLTSADVKYTFERVAADESLLEYPNYKNIDRVDIIDDYSFDIKTKIPLPSLLASLAKCGGDILPSKYIEDNGWDYFLKNPVYSGPYQYVEWVKDEKVVIKPFDEYFGGKQTEWDEVVFRSIPESSTRVGELLTNNIDIITEVPPNEWERVNGNETTTIERGDTTRIYMLVVRCKEGMATSDPKVREAIDLAINKEQICDKILQGAAVPTRTRVGIGVTGFNEELFNTQVYDPERAKELLKEAGYADGIEITLSAPRGGTIMDSEIAQMIAGMLEQANIHVNLELMEKNTLIEQRNAGKNKELMLIAYSDDFFDAAYPLKHYVKENGINITDYSNDRIESLYADAISNLDMDKRVEEFKEIQQIVADERPHICICQLKSNYGVNNRIEFNPRIDELIYVPDIKLK